VDDGLNETSEEKKLRDESRKILELPELVVSASCVRVPVYTGHSLAITAGFQRKITTARAEEILKESTGVVFEEIPTPMKTTGTDSTYVGRIRPDQAFQYGLSLFLSGDNLRKGAALNAVQIAEALI